MDEYLPEIHQEMIMIIQKENLGSVTNYNHILGTQMQKILERRQRNELVRDINDQVQSEEAGAQNTSESSDMQCVTTQQSTSKASAIPPPENVPHVETPTLNLMLSAQGACVR